MRISDWSSDVCSSDLPSRRWRLCPKNATAGARALGGGAGRFSLSLATWPIAGGTAHGAGRGEQAATAAAGPLQASRRVAAAARAAAPKLHAQPGCCAGRSEEHTSELQSLMRISYAVFCLKKKRTNRRTHDKKSCKQEN